MATIDDGAEVALARYYSTPGRIERELPDIALLPASVAIMADCASETCCCEA